LCDTLSIDANFAIFTFRIGIAIGSLHAEAVVTEFICSAVFIGRAGLGAKCVHALLSFAAI
jgi:hypothetical protein